MESSVSQETSFSAIAASVAKQGFALLAFNFYLLQATKGGLNVLTIL
ncbi:MAG: hypothetical protein WC272_08870 [Sulfurimonas sp.]